MDMYSTTDVDRHALVVGFRVKSLEYEGIMAISRALYDFTSAYTSSLAYNLTMRRSGTTYNNIT